MKTNFGLLSIIIFSVTLACQSPNGMENKLLNELYKNLEEQRRYTYEVAYSEGFINEIPAFSLFGTGKLVRNGGSSLSSFYFGTEGHNNEHFLFMMNMEGQYTEMVKSILFEEESADILADSLQSAILVNPEILLSLAEKGNEITVCEQKEGFKYEFFNQQVNRLVIIEADKENESLSKISIHQKVYNNRDYIRTWDFKHLNKEVYEEQIANCEQQFKNVNRRFL